MTEVIIKTVSYSAEIQAIKKIRTQVFQVEQGIANELEFDGLDETAIHLLAYLDNKPIGTARIRQIDEKIVNTLVEYACSLKASPTVKIERLSVLPLARRKGIGKQLMVKAIEVATSQNYQTIIIHAQQYIKSLYQQLGFEQIGSIFEEANIPHIKMIKKLDNNKQGKN